MELVYLEVDEAEQWRCVQKRLLTDPGNTFPMNEADLPRFRRIFQPSDTTELE